jgi:hypothetical protein
VGPLTDGPLMDGSMDDWEDLTSLLASLDEESRYQLLMNVHGQSTNDFLDCVDDGRGQVM